MPSSMRQCETGCGSSLAGGAGWAASPIEGGGYCSARSSSAPRASSPDTPTRISKVSRLRSMCIGRAPCFEVNPRPRPEGSTRSPWGDRAFRSKGGRLCEPSAYPVNGFTSVRVADLGKQPYVCHSGAILRSSKPGSLCGRILSCFNSRHRRAQGLRVARTSFLLTLQYTSEH